MMCENSMFCLRCLIHYILFLQGKKRVNIFMNSKNVNSHMKNCDIFLINAPNIDRTKVGCNEYLRSMF